MKARVHIVVGVLLLLISASLLAQEKRLVIAEGANYTTSLVISTDAPEQVVIRSVGCGLGSPGIRLDVHSAAVVRNAGAQLCPDVYSLADEPENASVVSVVRFDDGVTSASYVVPPIGSVRHDAPAVVGPLVSDEIDGAFVVVFPEKTTPMLLTLTDGATGEITVEEFEATPPVTLYRIKASGVFTARLEIGAEWWGCFPAKDCSAYGSVYGFASTGLPSGASLRNFPF